MITLKVDGVGYMVSGAAHFTSGEHVLLFLQTNDRGEWVPKEMSVGKFGEQVDAAGRRLLLRDASSIGGWDLDGTPHAEPTRDACSKAQTARAIQAAKARTTGRSFWGTDMLPAYSAAPTMHRSSRTADCVNKTLNSWAALV